MRTALGLIHEDTVPPKDAVPPESSKEPFRYFVNTLLYPDENGELKSGLAESWEVNETHIKFKLRQGIKCSNGSEFNAEYLHAHFYEHKEKWKDLSITSIDIMDLYSIIVEINSQNPIKLLSALIDSTNPVSIMACYYNHRFRGRL